MARDEHISVNKKQYLFLWLPELNTTGDINTSGYVTDISQLNGYNLQIELGDTATPYVPYGYLPMRRMKYKQNNVCQVLDKSKYYKTQTVNGVKFTNNGDGTITVNGTATNDVYYTIIPLRDTLYLSHQYLLTGENSGLYLFVENRDNDNKLLSQLRHNIIRSLPTNTKKSTFECYIEAGTVCDNLVLKPQLFDLTEMYGAGHEPTTVEQFRQDFPEEMYEYTPYCWASMKNIRYIDTTKNLFNQIGAALFYIDGSAVSKTFYYWEGSKLYTKMGLYYNNMLFPPTTLSAGTYTISAMASMHSINGSGIMVGVGFIDISNKDHTKYIGIDSDNQKISYTFTLTEEAVVRIVLQGVGNASNSRNLDASFSNIQLELGDTATNYVPYGYLPLN